MENNNKLFGICGSSGSGKSFIVKYVLENLGSDNVSVIYQDNYYKKREEQTKDANGNTINVTNIEEGTYSSEPYVLLRYKDESNRPAIKAYRVLRELEGNKFEYFE